MQRSLRSILGLLKLRQHLLIEGLELLIKLRTRPRLYTSKSTDRLNIIIKVGGDLDKLATS